MTPAAISHVRLTETSWRVIILALSLAVILFSVWCLSNNITTIFMHLYYFPIVLLAYRYRWKGLGIATLLALAYFGLVLVFNAGQGEVILGAFYRVLVFVGIAAVIAYLSERLALEKKGSRESTAIREQYISLAPAIILVLDRNGAITFLNRKGGEILECIPDEVTGNSWTDNFLSKKDRERVKQVFSRLITGQVEPDGVIENAVLTSSGREKIIRWHNAVLRDESGVITGILAFGEDITEEKKAQDLRRRLQQFQESVIANANVWISVLAPDGSTLLVWNDAAEAISGYKKSDVVGKNTVWKQLYPDPAYRKKVTGEIRRIIGRDNYLENFETEIHGADGVLKTIVWNTRGLRDSNGIIIGYIAIGHDVSAQKAAEEQARWSSALYREFFKTSHDCIFITSPQGQWIDFNESALEMFGYGTREELFRMPIAQLYHNPEDRKVFLDSIGKNGFTREYPVQLQRRDGSVIDTLITTVPIRNPDGSVRAFVGTIRDITEHKRAEESLAASEMKFRQFFNNIDDALYLHALGEQGLPGKFIEVNDVMCERLGYSRDELLLLAPQDIVSDAGRSKMPAIAEEMAGKGHATFETEHRRKDGSIIPVEVSSVLFSLAGVRVAMASARDITERKRAEEALRDSEEKFRDIFNNANDGIEIVELLDKGMPGKFIDVNEVACRMQGYTREEMLRLGPLDISTDYFNRPFDKIMRELYTTGHASFETEHRRKDGIIIPVEVNSHKITLMGKTVLLSITRDITERRQAEEVLTRSEERYRILAEASPDQIFINDRNGTILYANATALKLFGLPYDQVVGKQRKELFPPEQLVEQDATFREVFDSGEPVRREARIRFGEQVQWIDTNLVPLKDTAGHVTAVLGVARDITERKRAEVTLALEKQRMESLLSLSQTGRKSDTGIIAEVVEDFIRLTGSTIGYLATMNEDESVMTMQYWSKSAHESCRVIDKPIVYPIEKTGLWGEAVRQRKPIVTNDYAADSPFKRGTPPGHVRLVRHMNIPVFDGDRIVAIAGVGNKEVNYDVGDIRQLQLLTQGWWQLVIRKRAEIALRESEEKYRAFFTTTRDCIFITTIDGRWVDFNDAAVELFGYESRDDLMKITISSVYANPHERDSHIRYIRKNGYSFEYPVDLRKKDGTIINALITTVARKDASETIIGFQGSVRDVTERKRMENALRESEARLNSIIHGSPMLQFVIDKNHRVISWNKAIEEFSGIKEAEVLGTRDAWKAFYDTQRPVLSDVLVDEMVEQLPEWYKGKIIASRLVEGAYEGIDFFPKRGVSGTWLFFTAAPIRNADGEIIGAVETLEDITERKQAEEALVESRQLFSDIISFLPDPTFVIDRDGKVLAWNRAIEQLSGISAGDIIGKGDHAYSLWQYGKGRPVLIDLVLNRDLDAARLNYTEIHQDGSTITAQTEITHAATGKKIPLSLVASPLIDSLGNTTGAIESMRDVSRLKEAEAELARINKDLEQIVRERTRALQEEIAQRMQAEKDVQAALDYTRSVIEANPDLIVVLDEAGTILDVNAAGPSLTGIAKEQLIGTPYFGYLIDDGTLTSALAGLLDAGTLEKFVRIQRTDGHVTPLSVHAMVIPGWKGGKKRIIISGHDITRQKQDEEAIRASLDEKVLLLREVHHRVKNNLQIIISLVNLQMRQTGDPAVKQIMAETQNRVRAMSLVHEKLYRSESLSRIDFADYTRYLATQLFSFYGTDTRRVQLEMAMGKTMVDINTAVPLGLLVNELISNALKHAFPQGREGTIRIGGGEEENLITLIIQDDGVGIPADIDWKNTTSLGMRLVTSLIDQVDGTITLDRESGTMFTITVKREPEAGGTE